MIVSAGNRAAVLVRKDGKLVAVVLCPVHELERIAIETPDGSSLEIATPVFCDTADEIREVVAAAGRPPTAAVR